MARHKREPLSLYVPCESLTGEIVFAVSKRYYCEEGRIFCECSNGWFVRQKFVINRKKRKAYRNCGSLRR